MDFNLGDEDTPNFCHECKQQFDNSFELIDHALEDDEEFDPYYILPNGFKLLLGSLLRFMFHNAEDPDKIKLVSQSTYVTLFAGEMGYDLIDELVEDMVVKSALQDFDKSLEELLSGETNEEGGE